MKLTLKICALTVLSSLTVGVQAQTPTPTQREPVMSHISHPHNYYWREMYLPQLTSGPSSAAFSPDGKAVIYSMQGSLWRQDIESETAYQLTSGLAYDYQPDWSPNGGSVIFTRQVDNALHLTLLNLKTNQETLLTQGMSTNLEPRWSPDGRKVAFISSSESGYWGLYIADLKDQALSKIRPLVAGRVSKQDRYYYSQEDHAINPSWSPDGKSIYYVSNNEVSWGSGDIWSVSVAEPKSKTRVLVEETTWSARPELSHDGKRLLYSSYQGRQWHQLWMTTTQGQSPLPLTFGDYDLQNARWSHDDKQLLYISNETGGLTLWRHTVVGGARTQIVAKNKVYKAAMTTVDISLKDENGRALAGRVVVKDAAGRHYGPEDSRMHADDYLDPKQTSHETHYFHCFESCKVTVPLGDVTVQAMNGYEHTLARKKLKTSSGGNNVNLTLVTLGLPEDFGDYVSADMHVHMNYGGKYKQTLKGLAAQAKAEDLDIVYNLLVNKEQRIPDIAEFKTTKDVIEGVTLYQAQEYHSSYWGHVSFLHLDDHLLTPDFTSYRHTALRSPYPTNSVMIDLAKEQGAVVGYVHPFDKMPDVKAPGRLSHNLPVDVVLGKTNFLEVVAFANHEETAKVWYKFLNLGYRLAAGAGTDAMTNYASRRGPVGLNRAYYHAGAGDPTSLKKAIRAGNGFVTNAPLVGILAKQKGAGAYVGSGDQINLPASGGTISLKLALNSFVPVGKLEVVQNGIVVHTVDLSKDNHKATVEIDIPVAVSGWVLLRAVNEKAHIFVQDLYTYATTNPIWIDVKGKPQSAPEDAAYFLAWIERIKSHVNTRDADFNAPWEKEATMVNIEKATLALKGKLHGSD
jgi:TolB protein